jgi:hypothetical protein
VTKSRGDEEERRPQAGAPPALSEEVLAHLQQALLAAVLNRQALPGSDRPVALPDLQFVLGGEGVALAEENLVSRSVVVGLARPVRVLRPEELRQQAERRGEFAYLRFQPAEKDDDSVRLTLEARIARPDPSEPELGLSGVQARFVEVSGRWEVAEEPAFFAT